MLHYTSDATQKQISMRIRMRELDRKLGQCLAVSAEVKSVVCIPPDATDIETVGSNKISLLGIAEAAALFPLMDQHYITRAAVRRLNGEDAPTVSRYMEPTVSVRLVDGPIYSEFKEILNYLDKYAEREGYTTLTTLQCDRGYDFAWDCKEKKCNSDGSPSSEEWRSVILGGLNYSGPTSPDVFDADEYRKLLHQGKQPRFWSTNT